MRLNRSWWLWILVNLSRIVVALIFLFSGWIKVIDPMGMVYKLKAYSDYLGWGYTDESLLLKLGVAGLAIAECQLGLSLLLGIRRKSSTIFVFLFMLFVLGVTIFVYLKNPVPDCGCFGEVIKLTHGETLLKNVVLIVLSFIMLLYPRRMRRFISERNQWIISIYSFCFLTGFSMYSYYYSPVLTFTDYKLGVDVVKEYEGNGDAGDELRESIVTFSAINEKGEDFANKIFAKGVVNFLLTIPNVLTADDSSADRINALQDFAVDNGYGFYALISNDLLLAQDWRDRTGASYPIYQCDEVVLKSISRSNPGLMLLDDGVITGRWGCNELPESVEELPLNKPIKSIRDEGAWGKFASLFMIYIIPLLFVMIIDALWIGRKYYIHNRYMRRIMNSHLLRD